MNSSDYGQEAGAARSRQGCAEKQQWKNKLLVGMSFTASDLLEGDFGGDIPHFTHSIYQEMVPLLPWWYLIFFHIFQIPFPTDTLMF